MSKELLDLLLIVAALAPIASALILAISLVFAVVQIQKNRENQLRATAIALWDKYLDRTIQYPKFACPKDFDNLFNFDDRKFDGSREDFERYEWFVASLIRTSNEILCSYDKSDERNNMVRRNISYHKEYITYKGRDFFQDLGPDIWKIVVDVADEHDMELKDKN